MHKYFSGDIFEYLKKFVLFSQEVTGMEQERNREREKERERERERERKKSKREREKR